MSMSRIKYNKDTISNKNNCKSSMSYGANVHLDGFILTRNEDRLLIRGRHMTQAPFCLNCCFFIIVMEAKIKTIF